jgi:5-methylcytosine-specific restriction protein A
MCLEAGRFAPATELDHVVALMHGGGEQGNYQALCHDCHVDKTARDKGNKLKTNTGLDGWPL